MRVRVSGVSVEAEEVACYWAAEASILFWVLGDEVGRYL